MLRTVYGAMASGAGAAGPVSCDAPDVEVGAFLGDDDGALLLLNHANEKVTAEVTVDRPIFSVRDLRGGSSTEVGGYTLGVPLGPNGTAALRIAFVDPAEEAAEDPPDDTTE